MPHFGDLSFFYVYPFKQGLRYDLGEGVVASEQSSAKGDLEPTTKKFEGQAVG